MTNTEDNGIPDPIESGAGDGVVEEEILDGLIDEAGEGKEASAGADLSVELDKWKDLAPLEVLGQPGGRRAGLFTFSRWQSR